MEFYLLLIFKECTTF